MRNKTFANRLDYIRSAWVGARSLKEMSESSFEQSCRSVRVHRLIQSIY